MQIVDAGIMKGFETLIKLCGYIVLFSIVSRIPQTIAQKADCNMPLSADIIGAFFETTNGIGIVCGLCIPRTLSIVLCIALLSFGGVSWPFRPNQYSGIQALGFTDTYCLRQP